MKTIEEILETASSMPMLPDVVLRAMQIADDPEGTVDQLVAVMNLDQGVAANVLRLSNSAFYGSSRQIDSVREAVVYLGAKTVTDFMMASYCSQFFRRPVEAYGLEADEMWRHAVAVAIAAQAVDGAARHTKTTEQALEYTAGLLHDIGKIILDEACGEAFDEMAVNVEEKEAPFIDVEREVLGTDHCEVGAEVARRWRLPDRIVEAIRWHLEPQRAGIDPRLVACVHVGKMLVLTMGIGLGVDGCAAHFDHGALDLLDLKVPEVLDLAPDVVQRFNESIEML